jgi:hypothetical protein
MFLWRIYVAGNNETCFGIHEKLLILLSDFSKSVVSRRIFIEVAKYQISRKSVQCEPR